MERMQPNPVKITWEIKPRWRRDEIILSRAGLFMPAHLEGSSDSAARDSAAVLTAASRMRRRDKGERQLLFL